MRLRTRLILIFLALTLGTTAAAGVLAYRAAQGSVRTVALRVVGIMAQDRHAALVERLQRQQERGARFMAQTPACTRLPVNRPACDRAVHDFAVEEALLAATVIDAGRPVVSITTAANDAIAGHRQLLGDIPLLHPGQLARFDVDPTGFAYYDVAVPLTLHGASPADSIAENAHSADWLLLRYAFHPDEALFAAGSELGTSGETFLADAVGRPLSRLRFPMTADSLGAITAEPMRDCLRGHDGEVLAADYHGARIIHGYRYVPEIGGGCIMAHMSESEAAAPVRAVRDRLVMMGVVLGVLALIVSTLLARQIAAPLTVLVESAEAVARGERGVEPPVHDGVPEVRTLSRAFASMTAAVQRRTEEREAALASRARFYHAMNHELRTPLNAILGYLDLLLSGIFGPVAATQHDPLVRSQRAAGHLRDLIDDVLDLAKIEAGKIEVRRTPVQIGALLEDLLATLQPVAAASNVELRLRCGPDVEVETDARRLRQIVLNLVSNAIKFGGPSGVTITCRTLGAHGAPAGIPPMRVAIEVADRGPGIALSDQARIFEEYVQLERPGPGATTGTGLGLAISRRLAGALGGVLELESVPGDGATFRLLLP
jgi:signal transduction histidine kinase